MGEKIGSGKVDQAALTAAVESKLTSLASGIIGKNTTETHKSTIVVETKVEGAGKTEKELNKITSAANEASKALNDVKMASQPALNEKELSKAQKALERQFKTVSGVKRAMNFASTRKLRENAQDAIDDYMASKQDGIKGDSLKKLQGAAWDKIHAYQAMAGVNVQSLQKNLSIGLDAEEITSLKQFLKEVPDTAKNSIKTYFDTFKNMYVVGIQEGQQKLTEMLIEAGHELNTQKGENIFDIDGMSKKDLKFDTVFNDPKNKQITQRGLERTQNLLTSSSDLKKQQEALRKQRIESLKKYIVPFETFKENMAKLVQQENDYYKALDKAYETDESDDVIKTYTQKAVQTKAEIYKMIAGQKAQGPKNAALMRSWLQENVDEELYQQYHANRDSGRRTNYLQGYATNRFRGLDTGYKTWLNTKQNPVKWIKQQVQDIYDIEHLLQSSETASGEKQSSDQMVARMLSSIPNFENLIATIRQAKEVMAKNPDREVGFAYSKNGTPTNIMVGEKDRVNIQKLLNKDTIFTLHSHPNKNYAFPSHQGRAAGGSDGDIESWYQTLQAYGTNAIHAVMSDPSISDEISLFNLGAIPKDILKEFVEGLKTVFPKSGKEEDYSLRLQEAMRSYIQDFGLQNVDEIFHTMKLSDFMKITPTSIQNSFKGGTLVPKTTTNIKSNSSITDISKVEAEKQAHQENTKAIKEENEAKKEQQNITSSKDNTAQIKQEQKEHIKNKQAIEEKNKAKEESVKISDAETHKEVAEAVKEENQAKQEQKTISQNKEAIASINQEKDAHKENIEVIKEEALVKKEQEQISTVQNKETVAKVEQEKKAHEENIEAIKKENQIKEEQQNIDQKKKEAIQSQESKKGIETDQQIKNILNKAAKEINANKRYYKDEVLFDLQKQHKMPKEQEDRGIKGRINYYADLLSSIQSARSQVYQQAINEAKTNNSSISDSSNFSKYVNNLAKQAMQMKAIVSQVNMLRSKLNEPDQSKQLSANEIIQRYRTPDSVKEKMKQDERIKAQVQELSKKVDEDRKEAKEQLKEVGEQRELAKQQAKMIEEENKVKQQQIVAVKKKDETQNIQKESEAHKKNTEAIKEEMQAKQQNNANNQKTDEASTIQNETKAHQENLEVIQKEIQEKEKAQQNSSVKSAIQNAESVTNALKEETKQAKEAQKANEEAFKPLSREQLKAQLDERAKKAPFTADPKQLDLLYHIPSEPWKRQQAITTASKNIGINSDISLDRVLQAYNQQDSTYESLAQAYIRYKQIQDFYAAQLADYPQEDVKTEKPKRSIKDIKQQARQRREQQLKGNHSAQISSNAQNEIANQQQVSNAASNAAQQQVEANKKVIASEKEKQTVQKESINAAKVNVQEVKTAIDKELKALAQRDYKLKKTDPEAFNKITDANKQQKNKYLEQLKALETDNNRDSFLTLSLNLKKAVAAREEAYETIAKNYNSFDDKTTYNWGPATNIIQGHNSLINTISARINALNTKNHPNAQFLSTNKILQRYEEIRKSGIKKDRKDIETDLLSNNNFVEYKNNIALDSPELHKQKAEAIEAEATAREHNQQVAQQEGKAIADSQKQIQNQSAIPPQQTSVKKNSPVFSNLTREDILKQLESITPLSDEQILKNYKIPQKKDAKTRQNQLQAALRKETKLDSQITTIDEIVKASTWKEPPEYLKDPTSLMERLKAIKNHMVTMQRLQEWLNDYSVDNSKTAQQSDKIKNTEKSKQQPVSKQDSPVKNDTTLIKQEEQAHIANTEAIQKENAEKQKVTSTTIHKQNTEAIQQEAQAQNELKEATQQATEAAKEQQKQQNRRPKASLSPEQQKIVSDLKAQSDPLKQTDFLATGHSKIKYRTQPHQTATVDYKAENGKAVPYNVNFDTDFKGLSADLQRVDTEILKITASFERMTSVERQAAQQAQAPVLAALNKKKAELETELQYYSGQRQYAVDAVDVQKQVDVNHVKVSQDLEAQKAIADFEKVSSIVDKARDKIQSFGAEKRSGAWAQPLTDAVKTMQLLEQNMHDPDAVEKYNAELQKQLQILSQIQKETLMQNKQGFLLDQGQIKNAADMTAQMDKYAESMQLGSLMTEKWSADNTKVTRTYKSTSGQITQLTGQVEKLSNAWRMSSTVSQRTNAFMTGFAKSIGGVVRQLPMLIMGYSAVMKLRSEFAAGMNTFKEYDSTLTNISYTMNMTSKELDSLGKSAIDMARDLSMSVSNAEGVYKIYANMNTSAEEIQKLAKPTVILSNLSGVDASTAADEVQGIIQQFDMLKNAESDAADVSMHVVDVLNDISANVAMDYSFN